jgi:predicted PurR-regulated permease PerM
VQAGRVAERIVRFRARTILGVLAAVIAVALAIQVISIARQVIAWILISLFLALALNPAVDWLQRRGVRRRGIAVGFTFFLVIAAIVLIGLTFVPVLVDQVRNFVDAVPGYVRDITERRGKLGFLERKYHVVQRVRDLLQEGGAAKTLGLSALAVTRSLITAIVAIATIAVMTFFMLLEGPIWVERVFGLVPEHQQARWRKVGTDIYRTVGGYVTGNLLISLIAGSSSAVVLSIMGVPYAVALGLVVGILDLIPLAGATIAAIIVGTVAFLHSTTAGIVVVVFFVVYQQIENHVLQPLVYGRTVQLSPLVVLIAVLIGAELSGVLGALGAIPVAGAIQVLLVDWLQHRRGHVIEPVAAASEAPP